MMTNISDVLSDDINSCLMAIIDDVIDQFEEETDTEISRNTAIHLLISFLVQQLEETQ
jgi:hypothetical protein